jgi:hypothetical protein
MQAVTARQVGQAVAQVQLQAQVLQVAQQAQ